MRAKSCQAEASSASAGLSICSWQATLPGSAVQELPNPVLDALHASPDTAELALNGPACALFSKDELLIWQREGGAAAEVVARSLPYASHGLHHLAVLPDEVKHLPGSLIQASTQAEAVQEDSRTACQVA